MIGIVTAIRYMKKNSDGTYKLKDGAKVTKFPAKDLLKNIKPDAPVVKLSGDKKNITITPNEKDTDANSISVSYTGKDGSTKTTKATKAENGTWSISEGEGSVDQNGVVTLPKDKVKGDTTVTATVTDKGGIADDDKTPLTSDPGTLKIEETKADKVEALGGLDPVVLKKWVKDTIDWKDGVKVKDSATEENKGKINELLKGAKFEDVTEENRSTSKEGDFEGKIKITFDDKSELVVEKQMLYVNNHVTSMERKDKVPTDAVDVEFKLGEGTKVDNTGSGAIEGNKDNPTSYSNYKVKPGTNLKTYEIPTINSSVIDSINLTAQKGYTDPVWTSQNGTDFVASDTNEVFTATATKTYDITFDANSGSGTKDKVTQKVNTEYELPAADTFTAPENKQFSGWQVGKETELKQPGAKIKITGDTVVKAIWKPIEVKVKFQTEAGASGTMEDKTVNKGSKYELPKPTFTPEEGKEFAGWKVGNEDGVKKAGDTIKITDNVTLTATWKDIMVNVSYDANGGSGEMTGATQKKGSKYTLSENSFKAPNENQEFKAWEVNGKEVAPGTEITVDKDTVVKAIWKPIELKVNFLPGTGASGEMKDVPVNKGSDYKLPEPTFKAPENQEFAGWKVGNEDGVKKAGETIKITDNVTLTATWKDIEYKVTFNGNEGTGKMDTATVKKGEKYKLPDNSFGAPSDKQEFKTWEVDGKEVAPGTEITIDKDTVVKAIWKDIMIDITFDKGDGSGEMTKQSVKKGSQFKLPASTFTPPAGMQFAGWQVGDDSEVKAVGAEITINDNIKLTAVYKNKPVEPGKPDRPDRPYRPYRPYPQPQPKPEPKPEPKPDTKATEMERGTHYRYLYGYPDGTVRPEGLITRAEAAALIARLAKLDMSDASKPNFKDVPSRWYNSAINAVVKKNLMFANKDGKFRPNEAITRGEFARALFYIDKVNDAVAPFADVKGHEFEKAINQAYGNDRISGYPDGTFKPNAFIKRAEAAKILNHYANRGVDYDGILGQKKYIAYFTDLNETYWGYYEIMEAANSHEYERPLNTRIETWTKIINK